MVARPQLVVVRGRQRLERRPYGTNAFLPDPGSSLPTIISPLTKRDRGDEAMSGPWAELIAPNLNRFKVAAAFGQTACWNAEGSRAMAAIMSTMAEIIDAEIDRRDAVMEPSDTDGRVGGETPGQVLAEIIGERGLYVPSREFCINDCSRVLMNGEFDLDAIASAFKAAVLKGEV
jgi:hypothetical protein